MHIGPRWGRDPRLLYDFYVLWPSGVRSMHSLLGRAMTPAGSQSIGTIDKRRYSTRRTAGRREKTR